MIESIQGIKWTVLLWITLCIIASIHTTATKAPKQKGAIQRWKPQIVKMYDGIDIYREHEFPTPPIVAIILTPIVNLNSYLPTLVLSIVKTLMMFYCLLALHKGLRNTGIDLTDTQYSWATSIALLPVILDITHANINICILFLMVLSWSLQVRNRPILSGFVLGLAISCKVTPLLFVPVLIMQRNGKSLIGTACGLFTFLIVIPSTVLGFDQNLSYLQSWYEVMIEPYMVQGKVTIESVNQSLIGTSHRLFGGMKTADTDQDFTILPLPSFLLGQLSRILSILGLGSLFWFIRSTDKNTPHERQSFRQLGIWSFTLLWMLLLSERSWKHHYVTVLLCGIYLTVWIVHSDCTRFSIFNILFIIANGLFLTGAQDVIDPVFGKDASKLLQSYGSYTAGCLILVFLTGFTAIRSTNAFNQEHSNTI